MIIPLCVCVCVCVVKRYQYLYEASFQRLATYVLLPYIYGVYVCLSVERIRSSKSKKNVEEYTDKK